MQSFFTAFHMSSRNATWFYSEISIKHHPFDHKKLELAFHFDIFQCFSENSWDNICQPNCFIDYLPKWQSKFTNKRDTRNPKPIYIYIYIYFRLNPTHHMGKCHRFILLPCNFTVFLISASENGLMLFLQCD